MKMRKLVLMMALMVLGATGSYAQKQIKQTFQFMDTQSRAGDAVTDVLVKPMVVEVEMKGGKNPVRMVRSFPLSREQAEVAMGGNIANIRGWATYKANEVEQSDVIMGATYKIETNEEGGYTVTIMGYPAVFRTWRPATEEDYEWMRIQKLSAPEDKGTATPVIKTKN